MKAYTDLEQSKRLAEILPPESADMEYLHLKETNALISSVPFVKDESEVENSAYDAVYERIPCWSFTALFDVLPKNLDIGRPVLATNYRGYYWVEYFDEYMKETNLTSKIYNNPIDACVEMILKLHEQKLL